MMNSLLLNNYQSNRKCHWYYLTGVLFLTFLFHSSITIAQTKEVKFTRITGTNGISLGKINAIAQDAYGFLWLSDQTNRCVIRYDGSHMTRYAYNPKEENSLAGFYPESLYADSSGVMWIGYYGQGLDRFDTKTNQITHYEHDSENSESLSDNFVAAILRDHLGNLWVGTSEGLNLLNEETGKFINFSHNPNDTTSLSHNVVRTLYEDKQGTLWVGTGMAWDLDGRGGLNRFNRDEQKFTQYLHDPDDVKSLIHNKVRAIFEDSKGNFWVGTAGDGLHTMNRETGKFTRHLYDPQHPNRLSRSPTNNDADHITFITEDAENHIWIGTESGGILQYNPETQITTQYGAGRGYSLDFGDNSGWLAHSRENGLLYISTQEANLFRVDLYNKIIPHIKLSEAPHSFFELSDSELLLGTDKGLIIRTLGNRHSLKLTHDPNDPTSISQNWTSSIAQDNLGNIWIGTTRGLNNFDPSTKTFTRYLHDPNDNTTISHNDIGYVMEDSFDNLWIATLGGGINKMDRASGTFTSYQYNPADLNSISGNWVGDILQEDDNHLLVGSFANGGLNRMNLQTEKFERLLPGLNILDICKDYEDNIWIGTSNGLYRKNQFTNDFEPISEYNPDIDILATIRSIIEDDDNNLWMGTSLGIYRLNKKRNQINLYGRDNGLFGDDQFHLGSEYKGSDGQLYYSNFSGFYKFDPNFLQPLKDTSELFFTHFWVNENPIFTDNHHSLNAPLIKAKHIWLKHYENVFGISFTAVDFRNSSDQKIHYKLENFDTEWRKASPGERINYFNVPYGTYSFNIKTPNSTSGIWAYKSIDIIIAKPWWLMLWAYFLYGLLTILGIWIVHRYQKERVIKAEREKSQKRELEQARVIEKAYTDLKATQAQLIQSEKMASLGELTAGIAHEIQNPLNFVNNFSEVNVELLEEMKEEMNDGNVSEAESIANDVIENEQKIIYHGKRADGIVKNMLQHSRSRSGEKIPTDINKLVDEYLRLAYHGLRAKDKSFNAIMETDFDESIAKIDIIPQDIGRVILNLITNAFYAVFKKSKEGIENYNPTVAVSTKMTEISTGNTSVEIIVKDNGNGIPENIKDKIFQPFFTTKPTGQGTGLGLSLSYDIVKAHGGEIKVENSGSGGTQFIIKLPIV